MASIGFLQSVAEYYAEVRCGEPELKNIVFVLPNKRSIRFLREAVHRTMKREAYMPRFTTMRGLLSRFSPFREVDDLHQNFVLYSAYREVAQERSVDVMPFDKFIFYGEIIRTDFDDIDRALVPASELFKNLTGYKEIQADYLNDSQKEIIRRIWGPTRVTDYIEGFWAHIRNDNGEEGKLAEKFASIWELLEPVYVRYNEKLDREHIDTVGRQYKKARRIIASEDASGILKLASLPCDTHFVFVGFNDASIVETLIFQRLYDIGIASFFWDVAPLNMFGNRMGEPLERLRRLAQEFPAPVDYIYKQDEEISLPQIDIYAVPSNTDQVKCLASKLREWCANGQTDGNNAINTAIVMPEQALLMPLMYSIPAEIGAFNVTMSISFRATTFASLLQTIISMQLRARKIHEVWHFFHEDVKAVLDHPHIRMIDNNKAETILTYLTSSKLYNVDAANIASEYPEFAAVFTPVQDINDVNTAANYLLNLFSWLLDRLVAKSSKMETLEISILEYFIGAVGNIAKMAEQYGVDMEERTMLHMFERILNLRGVPVDGTPLRGLQILGVLETRALDFENVIVPSMNERIFPRRQYIHTMIPNKLRCGYGLPDFSNLEWTYAYCFYRLIARAKRVALYYDSRVTKVGSNEMSRYITQMMYLMPELKVKHHVLGFEGCNSSTRIVSIPKNTDVLARLEEFKTPGKRNLSASALKRFKKCPLQFYFADVCRMRGQDEVVDYFTAAEHGTIVHNVIQKAFENIGNPITSDKLRSLADENNLLLETLALNEVLATSRFAFYRYGINPSDTKESINQLPAEARIEIESVAAIARADILAEVDAHCSNGRTFNMLGSEVQVNKPWRINPGLEINWTMSIDRVDKTGAGLRFVDFKTGSDELNVKSIEGLFGHDNKKDGMFQVLAYCQAYKDIIDEDAVIEPVIHATSKLIKGEGITHFKIDNEIKTYDKNLESQFKPHLYHLIERIFNVDEDFYQLSESKLEDCRYCAFRALCGRPLTPNN